MRRWFSVLAVLLTLAFIAACSRPSNGEEATAVLEVGATGEPAGMDMTTVDGAGTPFVLLYNVYETLVKLDANREVQPLLAESWDLSEDRLTYTFSLNPAAKFADGTPVDANAVASSFQRILDGDAKDRILAAFEPVESVTAVDATTVTIQLSRPSNKFLIDLTTAAGIIVNPAVDVAELSDRTAGSGPYQLDTWEPGSLVRLTQTESYWGTRPHFDVVNFRYYADPNAMNTAMLSGQLDIISNLTVPQQIDQFSDESKYTVLEGNTDGEVLLSFNHSNEALSDVRVRQAINYAIDRQSVVDSAWGGKGELIGSMVPLGEPWYEDLSDLYPYDPDRARALLQEAGATDLTLRLRVPTLPYAPPAARSIQAQLAEVGITAEIEELEFARWLDLVFAQGDFDMTIVAHVEPRDLSMYVSGGNYVHYANPEFDRLIQEADQGSEEEFISKQREAARLLAEDAAADWLWLLPNIIITKPDIAGVQPDQTSSSFDLTTIASSR